MDSHDLLRHQLDDASYQLGQVLSGFPEEAMDSVHPGLSMTPRELVAHLGEAYLATVAQLAGEEYAWGSYRLPEVDTTQQIATVQSLRAEAVAAVLAGGDDALKAGHAFIVAHDYYHVGQLCSARLSVQPDWEPYSIYR